MKPHAPVTRHLTRARLAVATVRAPAKLARVTTGAGAVDLLQELLRVESVNPPGDEAKAAQVLESFLSSSGLRTEIVTSPGGRANLIARAEGRRDTAALVLLSHTDVVPVEREQWSRDPFGGEIADDFVWGRGALDMKGIAAMHAAAAAAVAQQTLAREVIVVSVADEEAGGREGARWLLEHHPDKVGFEEHRPPPEALGEGGYGLEGVLDAPVMPVVVGEKSALWLEVCARGEPGHGSLPPDDQAVVKLASFVTAVAGWGPMRVHPVMRAQFELLAGAASSPRSFAFRALASRQADNVAKLLSSTLRSAGVIGLTLADTVTVTQLSAGYKHNVVPGEARAALDCRLLPHTEIDEFVDRLRARGSEEGITIEVLSREGGPVSRRSPLYAILADVSAALPGRPVAVPSLTPGMTDVRFFRARGAPGFGWVPLVLDQELLGTIHGHDERIPVDGFVRAVEAMIEAVRRAAT